MKRILLLATVFLCANSLLAQEEPQEKEVDTLWADQINYIFEEVDLARVPHGILLDFAMEFTDVTAYNGASAERIDSLRTNIDVLSNIYKTLFMGRVTTDTIYFPRLESIAQTWATERLGRNQDEKNTLVLGGLFYRYSKIRPDAMESGDIVLEGNRLFDAYENGVWQNPYETKKTFAVAFPLQHYNKLDFKVVLPENLWLGNQPDLLNRIEVDMGDGQGFRPLPFGQELNVHYPENGTYHWSFKAVLNDGSSLYSHTSVAVSVAETVADTDVFIPGDELFTGAYLRIDYAPGHSQLTKPFIIAEGFDTGAITKPEVEGGDNTLSDFKIEVEKTNSDLDYLLTDTTQEYDLVYIDWLDGTARLEDNSEVLENVLDYVNANKVGNEQNVLLGQSMGGVIGRYTLARMEQEGDVHDVRLFISHDAPLQGSNTPLATQFFTRHLLDVYVNAPMLYELGQISLPVGYGLVELVDGIFGGSMPQYVSPGDVLTIQDTPAAVQMNYEWVTPSGNVGNAIHEAWQQEFDGKGYPQNSRNIAISNGNECGKNHGFGAGEPFLDINDSDNPDFWGDLAQMLYVPAIGIYLNDIELMLLGSLPGESKWEYDFDLESVPVLGSTDRKVYFGRVRYHKNIDLGLFEIAIQHTVTEDSKNAPANSLPYATFPGGSYDISNIEDQFDGQDDESFLPPVAYINPNYGFVPVVSALDARRNNNPIDDPIDFKRNYAGGQINYPNLTTEFDNFIVHYSESPVNAPHISFSVRNGNWLAQELQVNSQNPNYPIADCSILCSETFIEGTDIICSDPETFSIPAMASNIDWGVIDSDNLVTISTNDNMPTFVVTPNSTQNGEIILRVNFDIPNCGGASLTKKIWVGAPGLPALSAIYGATSVPAGVTYTWYGATALVNENDQYRWVILYNGNNCANDPGATMPVFFGTTTNDLVSPSDWVHVDWGNCSGSYTLECYAVNKCGSSLIGSMNVEITPCAGELRMYPNPVEGGSITANLIYPGEPCGTTPPMEIYNLVEIYDLYGNLKFSTTFTSNEFLIEGLNYELGHYIVRATDANGMVVQELIVVK